ncbi:MAG: aminobutyraldehyde dehydrogenase [Bifidobacteriaceae bacterium]|nr:aminobutyraldehyde dehydrogenase [Bifidobacteriaceae bacterium]
MATQGVVFDNVVNGLARPAATYLQVTDPSTGEPYAIAPNSSAPEVAEAFAAAEAAFAKWRRATPKTRQEALLALADALEARADEFNAVECRDTGKPLQVTRTEELPLCVDHLRFFAGAARLPEGLAAGEYLEGFESAVRREPLGVCAQVTPWNYPLAMAVWKIAPALAAGNTVVLKPSELTPASTVLLAQVAAEILPSGVFNVVCGDRDTGRALAAAPGAAMVAITGSERAGIEVAAAAARDVKRSHLELGGNAPALVFADADLERAAQELAIAGTFNAGQDCTAAARVLVERSAYADFLPLLAGALDGRRTGAPDEDVDYGALSSEAHLEKVLGFIDTLPPNARIVTGGRRVDRPGYFVEPTLIDGLAQGDRAIQEEIFGPVLTLQVFDGEAQALALANGVRQGLGSSVWTREHARALRCSAALDFGVVWVNAHLPFVSEMPHGGFKHSGYGKDLSKYAFEEYTRVKHVMSYLGDTGEEAPT